LSQVERGIRGVDRFSTILALAKVLKVDVVELTGRRFRLAPPRPSRASGRLASRGSSPSAPWPLRGRSEAPVLMSAGAYHLGQAFLRAGQLDDASSVVVGTAELLERDRRNLTPERLSAAGALYLTAAIAAARDNDRGRAEQLLTRAARHAEAIEDGLNHLWFAFGRLNLAIHRVAVAIELGDPRAAIRHGEALDLTRLPAELPPPPGQLGGTSGPSSVSPARSSSVATTRVASLGADRVGATRPSRRSQPCIAPARRSAHHRPPGWRASARRRSLVTSTADLPATTRNASGPPPRRSPGLPDEVAPQLDRHRGLGRQHRPGAGSTAHGAALRRAPSRALGSASLGGCRRT